MNSEKINSLISSLVVLFEAIRTAEDLLINNGQSHSEAFQHIKSYKDICFQQLEMAHKAVEALDQQDAEQARRYLNLVNELAELVKEDAHDILDTDSDHYSARNVI